MNSIPDKCLRFRSTAFCLPAALLLLLTLPVSASERQATVAGGTLHLTRAAYLDRVQAIWTAQMIAQMTGGVYEHQTASVVSPVPLVTAKGYAPVDDDYYYEMVAIRAFEKYGPALTVEQLGDQWLANSAGSWGSSEQARLLLGRGIRAPLTGNPRYNRLWWTIGAQFSSDVYGALAPGMPNLAGALARNLGHINSYAEGTDGGVFIAAMVSLGFVESDTHHIVREAASLIAPESPYRQCLEMVIRMAEDGKSSREVFDALDARWGIEYPATNNAVLNGGIVATSVWFGGGDFLKTLDLASGATDFADADCNAANSASVVAAMHGMAALPPAQVAALHDRIFGETMGDVKLTPAVDESISALAARTVAVGEKILLAHGAKETAAGPDAELAIQVETPRTQPAELFPLGDLTQLWNPQWKLERAGFGGSTGGIAGLRGATYLEGDVLATFPRDEVRGAVLRREATIGPGGRLAFSAGADPGRCWRLQVYVQNDKLLDRVVVGADKAARHWELVDVDLSPYAGRRVTVRLYDLILLPRQQPGNAYWKDLRLTP